MKPRRRRKRKQGLPAYLLSELATATSPAPVQTLPPLPSVSHFSQREAIYVDVDDLLSELLDL
jgi:hypothetical protein